MFSNLSNTSDGCDTCATLDQAFGGSGVSDFSNNNVVNQHANTVSPGSVGLASNVQSQNQMANQNAIRPAINNIAVVAQQAQQQLNSQVQQAQQATNSDASNAQVAMNNMVKKAISPKVVNGNGNNKRVNSFKNLNTVASSNQVQVNIPGKMVLLNLGVVFLAALSLNECFKYYINRGIQRAEGQPHYYAGYAFLCVLLVFVIHLVSKRNI